MRKYTLPSGKIYNLPNKACVFCKHCCAIWWDYTHGIHTIICLYDDKDVTTSAQGNIYENCPYFKLDKEYRL